MVGEYTEEDGKRLLKLARDTIDAEFNGKEVEIPPEKQFRQLRGVFVTLKKHGKLRGCIGFAYPKMPLNKAVIEAARAAAFNDLRFDLVKVDELKDIEIELSILSVPADIKNVKEISAGTDGLMCDYLGYCGLLLPQVASEHKMDRIQFLEALCSKAGLPKNTWENKNFKIKKFQCQIFNE